MSDFDAAWPHGSQDAIGQAAEFLVWSNLITQSAGGLHIFLPMLDRQIARRGAPPRQTAADGGYASRDNLKQAKARGVQDVAFHKKCGIAVADMVKSQWVYRRLRNFRAGIEAGISVFKRAYGGARCIWRGLDHFKAYIWSAVVAHNLMLFARLKSP